MIENHHQQKILQLNFIVFELFVDYFSMVSAVFSYIAAAVVDDVVLVDYELSVISMFLSFVL